MENMTERGGISIELEHIFPIIKKWLYSEKEIFVREIVSNACDAITKLRRLNSLAEADVDLSDAKIRVILDKDASTITVTDTGIGMTEEELKKYICQIALSGDAQTRDDIIYLEKLPVFHPDGTVIENSLH